MRRRFLLIICLVATTIGPVRAGVDLTPSVEEYTSEGLLYRRVTLKTDTGNISFVPPRAWNVRGAKDRLQMEPPDQPFSEATVVVTPTAGPVALDEPTVKALEQQVLSGAPPASQSVQILGVEENPVLSQNPSVQITISYDALGHTFQRSVIFLNTRDIQLVFRLTAPKSDFGPLDQAFRRSINSWQWNETKPVGSGRRLDHPGPTQNGTSAVQ